MSCTDRKISKGNEYAYRIFKLDTKENIMVHTDRKISKLVTDISLLTGRNLLLIDEYENTPNFGIIESLVLWN
jgi:hypothetical protein